MKKFIIFLSICIIGMFNIQPAIYVKADSGENVEIKIKIGKKEYSILIFSLFLKVDFLIRSDCLSFISLIIVTVYFFYK